MSSPEQPRPTTEPVDLLDTPEAGARVLRGSVLRAGGFVAGTAFSVLAAALLTRELGRADYGRYQQVVGLVTIVQTITDVGMATLAMREYAQRRGGERARVLALLLGLRAALTFVGIALTLVAGLALGYDGPMLAGAALMGLGLLIIVLQTTLAVPLNAEIRMGAVTGIDVLRQALLAVGTALLVLVGAGIVPFLAVTIPVHLVLLAITVPLVRGQASLRPAVDLRAWGELLRPALTFSLATAVGTIYIYTALVLCGQVASEDETGLFAASFRVYLILAAVPGLLAVTAFPVLARAARDDRERLAYAVGRLSEAAAVVGGAAAVATVLGAPFVIAVIAGPDFAGAIDVLRVQGIALALTFVVAPWGFTLLSGPDQRPLLIANAVAFAVSAVTVLLLASAYGALGAAYGTLLGEAVLAVGYLVGLRRGGAQLRFDARRALRVLPALALGLAVGLLGLPSIVAAVLGLVVYAALVLVLRAVPEEAYELLPARLRGRS